MELHKIKTTYPKNNLINENNLRKLTGHGKDVGSVLNYAIRHFQENDYPNLSRDWFSAENLHKKVSLCVSIHPAYLASDPEFIEDCETNTRLQFLKNKNHQDTFSLMEINGRITHLDPKGRPVFVTVYPTSGGKDPKGDIEIYSIGDPNTGPLRSMIAVPISYVVNQSENFTRQYVIYVHSISSKDVYTPSEVEDFTLNYIGLTKQGWRKRFSQHMSNARSGSPLLFHKALRDHYVGSSVVAHRVVTVCETEKEAMDAEELLVEGGEKEDFENADAFVGMDGWVFGTLYPKGLNMIPGGYAGLRVLHKMGAMKNNKPFNVEQRDKILMSHVQKEGRSNPLLAAHWENEDYATKIICGPEDRLKPHQIQEARTLGFLGREPAEIVKIVGAKNERQIQNLLAARTYSRISCRK